MIGNIDMDRLVYDPAKHDFKGKSGRPIKARMVNITDGDTARFLVRRDDLIPEEFIAIKVRMSGYNTPEVSRKSEREIIAGRLVKDAVEKKLSNSTKLEVNAKKLGIYGRFVAEISVDGESLTEWIIDNGLGVSYDGRRKAPQISDEQINEIIEKLSNTSI